MVEFYFQRFKSISRCPQLLATQIAEISKKIVYDYMHMRKKQDRVSNSTVNRDATILKTMLNKAVEWEIIDNIPIEKLKLFPEPQKRNVELTIEEAVALLHELSVSFALIVEYTIYTGFRLENILDFTVEQIRFHDVGNTGSVKMKVKGGMRNSYPVGPNAMDVLIRAIGDRKTGYVFINKRTGTRYYSVSDSFRRAVRRLGLKVSDSYLRFHDLKHVFATWLHERGVTLDTLRVLCQHRKRSTTDRYTTANTAEAYRVLSLMPKIENPNSRKVRAI
ncbi:tyrosine-type recombinase/integrase [Candidatus Omnitrophota bacterium]